jgi:hypothetical protein
MGHWERPGASGTAKISPLNLSSSVLQKGLIEEALLRKKASRLHRNADLKVVINCLSLPQ